MRPTTLTVGPLSAAVADNIAQSQTPSAAFTLNGSTVVAGIAVLDTPRRVLVITLADESAKTITIVGTDAAGVTITEVMAGPNASSAYTTLDFKTVTSARISAAAGGAITIGTNGVASSRWMRMDDFAPTPATIHVTVSGTVNYTVQTTMQDPDSPTNPVLPYLVTWLDHPDPNVVGATTSWSSYNTNSPTWMKLTLNSETGTGSASMVVTQMSAVPY